MPYILKVIWSALRPRYFQSKRSNTKAFDIFAIERSHHNRTLKKKCEKVYNDTIHSRGFVWVWCIVGFVLFLCGYGPFFNIDEPNFTSTYYIHLTFLVLFSQVAVTLCHRIIINFIHNTWQWAWVSLSNKSYCGSRKCAIQHEKEKVNPDIRILFFVTFKCLWKHFHRFNIFIGNDFFITQKKGQVFRRKKPLLARLNIMKRRMRRLREWTVEKVKKIGIRE